MAFLDEVDSIRTKAHLGSVSPVVLLGVVLCALLVFALVAITVVNALDAPSFSISSSQSASEDTAESATAVSQVTVYVTGCVAAPGVYSFDASARVNDAVVAAGGFTPEAATDRVNLARVLVDGEQIFVSALDQGGDAVIEGALASVSSAAVSGVSGKVNINTASAAELETLDGIGEATARKIIASRESEGPFISIEDLKRVSGIGEKKYAALADGICV